MGIKYKGIFGKNGWLSFFLNTFETIRNVKRKLKAYAIFKQEIGFEKYLSDIKNPIKRVILTKFRLSNRKLMSEAGYIDMPKEIRCC